MNNAHTKSSIEDRHLCADQVARNENHQELALLVDELHHRLRNIIAIVQAVARRTRAATVAEYRDRLLSQLGALAVSIEMNEATKGVPVRLTDLIVQTLTPYSGSGTDRIVLSGPEVAVEPKLSLPLCLVFAELATNASEYGALSSSSGFVTIRWRLVTLPDDKVALAIWWREHDGPPVRAPHRRGLGSRLFDRAFDNNGKIDVRFCRDGLTCFMLVAVDSAREAVSNVQAKSVNGHQHKQWSTGFAVYDAARAIHDTA
jgi:two-component sensor histidine kinase